MTNARIIGWAVATMLVLLVLVAGYLVLEQAVDPASAVASPADGEAGPSVLYGRISAFDGATYQGRLRWGGGEEAFWGDYFNGTKKENPWVAYVPPERLNENDPIEIFGVEISSRERPIETERPFMTRFGDIARIEARGGDVQVTLKSGTVFNLDRFSASDFDDGVRVWDGKRGVVDLDSLRIRSIELLPAPGVSAATDRLHGTVTTRQGDFTGFLQWDREKCVGSDLLNGNSDQGELSIRFDTIRSIARDSGDSARVTLLDGGDVLLSFGRDNRGIYVDDRRYGRLLVSWDVLERVEFSPGGSGPAYGDFPAAGPLTGSVTTWTGSRLTGRLVYDLDESETTETLDAPLQGVDYTIPFGLIASIVPPGGEGSGARYARVTLHNGEELRLEPAGDLGEGNAGMLVFVKGRQRPEYVPWAEVETVDFHR